MNENSRKICRFCLTDINDKYFGKIDPIVREMVNVLYLKIDLDISEDPIMCTDCADNLCKAFKFKSTGVHTEDYLLPRINFETDTKINMQEAYLNINEHKNIEDQSVCRFCRNVVSSKCSTLLNELLEDVEVMKNILEEHFPEMDLYSVKEPVICELCLESLNDHLDSITNWINVEKRVQSYIRRGGIYNAGKIDLRNVQQFLEQPEVKMEVDLVADKTETQQECYKFVQDMNMITQIKNEDHFERESLQLTIKNEEIDLKVDEDNNNESFRNTPFTSGDVTKQESNDLKLQDATEIETTSLTYKCEKYTTHEDNSYVPHSSENDCRAEFENNWEQQRLQQKEDKYKESYKLSSNTHMKVSEERSVEGHKCENDDDSLELTLYKCGYENCLYKTKAESQLKKHILIHKKPSELRMFKCDHENCSYKAKRRPDLKKHMLIHKNSSELKMYKCEYENCLYETKFKCNLKTHVVMHKNSSELTMYKCEHENCVYQTKFKSNLNSHIMLIHKKSNAQSKLTIYKCEYENCLYETNVKPHIKRHMLIHKNPSELTMYKCGHENCSYTTKLKWNLNNHGLIHKDPSELTMYNCEYENCLYKTKIKSHLNKHMLIHKNPSELTMYKCEYENCLHETKVKSQLNRHRLIHRKPSELPTYVCGHENCSYKTKVKCKLKSHVLIHKKRS